MNDTTHKEWHRLFGAALNDVLTDSEKQQLATLLEASAEARELWFLYHDNECGLTELKQSPATRAATIAMLDTANAHPQRPAARRLQWRPLTAAAAGLVFGMFCTSMVFGFVVQRGIERKVPVELFEPGFEDAQMPLAKDFPDTSARWGGDAARVVAVEDGVQPKEGKFMLRLEPAARGVPRIFQVVDLQSLPSSQGPEMRQIEVEASFAAADADASVRYLIRAFAVSEAPESLDAAWFDHRDEAISSATIGLDRLPGDQGWQAFGLRIQVPPTARSLVLFFGVRTPDKAHAGTASYLDDVQVSLIDPLPLP